MHAVMRVSTLILILILACVLYMCGCARPNIAAPIVTGLSTSKPETPATNNTGTAKVDFATQIKPLLESRCTPCHFAGGKMYQRLPFDRPETIYTLGTKLFTRIKDENEQRLIREFLAQQSK